MDYFLYFFHGLWMVASLYQQNKISSIIVMSPLIILMALSLTLLVIECHVAMATTSLWKGDCTGEGLRSYSIALPSPLLQQASTASGLENNIASYPTIYNFPGGARPLTPSPTSLLTGGELGDVLVSKYSKGTGTTKVWRGPGTK